MFAGCRCPRCDDTTLKSKALESCDILACRRCSGGFVSANVGLRLLAVLKPDVAAVDEDAPRAPCPVCRKPMKLVTTGEAHAEMDTCAQHGVWFDSGDLSAVVRAVANALGKPVPEVVGTLDAHTARRSLDTPPPAGSSNAGAQEPNTGPSRPVQHRPLSPMASAAFGAVGTVGNAVDTAVSIVAFPFQLTLATVELLTELVD